MARRILIAVPADVDGPRFKPSEVPAHVRVNLAQAAHDAILRDFENPEVKADYDRWKCERDARRETA